MGRGKRSLPRSLSPRRRGAGVQVRVSSFRRAREGGSCCYRSPRRAPPAAQESAAGALECGSGAAALPWHWQESGRTGHWHELSAVSGRAAFQQILRVTHYGTSLARSAAPLLLSFQKRIQHSCPVPHNSWWWVTFNSRMALRGQVDCFRMPRDSVTTSDCPFRFVDKYQQTNSLVMRLQICLV